MLINKIKLNNNDIENGYVTIPFNSNFSPETNKYENVEDNFDLTSSDIINPIIDYEKIKLFPISTVGYYLLDEEGDIELTESGETSIVENYEDIVNDEVDVIDSLKFNLHFCNTGNTSGWDDETTKVGNIGFSSDDIKYRREKVSKSFIRLSFYDSNDLKTQNLLYYSTIFLDSNSLYYNYIQNNGIEDLNMSFITENSKLSNKIKSFEGYNLYLFKSDIPKKEIKTIYLRVDFSNAINGHTILFLKNKPSNKNGFSIKELYSNLFIEIKCFYDESSKKYLYFFNDYLSETVNNLNDKLIKTRLNIDLFQAKAI